MATASEGSLAELQPPRWDQKDEIVLAWMRSCSESRTVERKELSDTKDPVKSAVLLALQYAAGFWNAMVIQKTEAHWCHLHFGMPDKLKSNDPVKGLVASHLMNSDYLSKTFSDLRSPLGGGHLQPDPAPMLVMWRVIKLPGPFSLLPENVVLWCAIYVPSLKDLSPHDWTLVGCSANQKRKGEHKFQMKDGSTLRAIPPAILGRRQSCNGELEVFLNRSQELESEQGEVRKEETTEDVAGPADSELQNEAGVVACPVTAEERPSAPESLTVPGPPTKKEPFTMELNAFCHKRGLPFPNIQIHLVVGCKLHNPEFEATVSFICPLISLFCQA